jgi:hypothetical protein
MNELNPFSNEIPKHVSALTARESSSAIAEVQAAMAIARMNPRDQIGAMDRILNACTRPTLADSAIYSYAKGGSDITGPSIRLAETLAQNWGNISFGIRELETSDDESTVQSYCWDMETNTKREITFTVPHVRDTKAGKKKLTDSRERYENMANQASRRLRACILAVIPGDVTEAAVNQCEVTMNAKADTSPEGIKKMIDAFAAFNVSQAQIEKFIQRRLESIQPAQLVRLKKVYASIKDGMSKASDWFEQATETNADDALNQALANKKSSKQTKWKQLIKDAATAKELNAIWASMPESERPDCQDDYEIKTKSFEVKE